MTSPQTPKLGVFGYLKKATCVREENCSGGLLESQTCRVPDVPSQNILELYNVLVQVRFATSKTKLDI